MKTTQYEPPSAERHTGWCERDLNVTYSIGQYFMVLMEFMDLMSARLLEPDQG